MADVAPPSQKKTLDAAGLLKQMGVQSIVGEKAPGLVTVMVPDPNDPDDLKQADVDLNEVIRAQGLDPKALNVEISSPAQPLRDSNLGFMDKMQLAVMDKPSDRAKFLAEKFGKDNVSFNTELKDFVVKNEGVWSKAHDDTWNTFFADLAGREQGAIAGGIAGAKAGAALGGIPGAIIGSGLGAVIGKLGTMGAAKAMGIRSEVDAQELSGELLRDAIFGMAGEGIGKGLNKAFQKISTQASGGTKRLLAETMESQWGVDQADSLMWLNETGPVEAAQKQAMQYADIAADTASSRPNPMISKISNMFEEYYDKTKSAAVGERGFYKQFMTENADALSKTRVDLSETADVFRNSLSEMGFLDEAGNFVKPKNATKLQAFNTPSSVRQLENVWNKMRMATKNGTQSVDFETARLLRSNIDDVLEASGMFGSGQQITSGAQRPISMLRASVSNAMQNGVKEVDPVVATKLSEMNARYHAVRSSLDKLAPMLSKVDSGTTAERILNPAKNDPLSAAFFELADAMGDDAGADALAKQIRIMRAGINTTKYLNPKSMGLSAIAQKTASWVPVLKHIARPNSGVPLTAKTFARLQGIAKAAEWVKGRTPGELKVLLGNPEAMQAYLQAATSADEGYDQAQKMAGEELQKVMGQPR